MNPGQASYFRLMNCGDHERWYRYTWCFKRIVVHAFSFQRLPFYGRQINEFWRHEILRVEIGHARRNALRVRSIHEVWFGFVLVRLLASILIHGRQINELWSRLSSRDALKMIH